VPLMIAAPMLLSGARLAILEHKTAAVAAQRATQAESARRAALYAHLEQTRWPMTKLMADIAAAAPVGVVVDTLRISPEQGLSLQGTAKSSDLLNQLEQNLNKTGLFRDVKID